MKKIIVYLLAALAALPALAQDMIPDHASGDEFPLVSPATGAVPIYVDPKDHWLVGKAAEWLQQDIQQVTGQRPAILSSLPSTGPIPFLIIIGSLDTSTSC